MVDECVRFLFILQSLTFTLLVLELETFCLTQRTEKAQRWSSWFQIVVYVLSRIL